jgi:hypothetical protein
MAQFETIGGGSTLSADRAIIRKVVVGTDGEEISVPSSPSGYILTNSSITQEAGGVQRAVFEYTAAASESSATYNQYGKRVELTGGTREVPIQTHPAFKTLSETQIAEVLTKIENPQPDFWATFADETQQLLYNFLRRKVDYALAPAIVGRVSEFESTLPDLSIVAKVANPPELTAPEGNFWICTSVTASPIGERYEVTREYTLNFSDWEDVETLYGYE